MCTCVIVSENPRLMSNQRNKMARFTVLVVLISLLVACGGGPESVMGSEPAETGGSETGGSPATGGLMETGGTETGGSVVAVGCEPRRAVTCPCVGGQDGVQSCLDDGSGWTTCECPEVTEPDGAAGAGGAEADDNGGGGSDVQPVCRSGAQSSCQCDSATISFGDTVLGFRVCLPSRTGWGPCYCPFGPGGDVVPESGTGCSVPGSDPSDCQCADGESSGHLYCSDGWAACSCQGSV